MELSENEAAWIAVFLEAWTQSIVNHYSNLKKLEECPIPFVLVPCTRFKLPEGVIVDIYAEDWFGPSSKEEHRSVKRLVEEPLAPQKSKTDQKM